MQIMDGKVVSAHVEERVKEEVARHAAEAPPVLALVQVGEDPASSVYVKSKARMSERVGIESRRLHLDAGISEAALIGQLRELSSDPAVHGILLQLPLPGHINSDRAIAAIDPIKDVDGFHPENLGLLASGKPRYVACTPLGIREMLLYYDIKTSGKHAVVIGRSLIVGKPMALLLSMKGPGGDATVTVCHSRTMDIGAEVARADIIIAAIGAANFVTGDMVKPGAVVIDVGINRVKDETAKKGYRIVGDVDFDAAAEKSSFITPVPGGVGKMTVAMLMSNTVDAYKLQVAASNAV